jgi:hypothetical protein
MEYNMKENGYGISEAIKRRTKKKHKNFEQQPDFLGRIQP